MAPVSSLAGVILCAVFWVFGDYLGGTALSAESWESGRHEPTPIHQPAPPPDDGPPLLEHLDAQLAGDDTRLGLGGRARILGTRVALNGPAWLGRWIGKIPRWGWYLGRDFFVGFARVAVFLYQWGHMSDERHAVHQMENRDARATKKLQVHQQSRIRWIIAAAVAVLLLLAHLVTWGVGSWQIPDRTVLNWFYLVLLLEGLGLITLFEVVGHRRIERDDPVRRRGPLTHATSSRTLRRDLEDGFLVKKMAEVGVQVTVNKYGWHGQFETELDIPDSIVEHLERWVHAPRGSLMVSTDSRNAASHPFKLLIQDPLETPSVPDDETDLDIRRRQRIGRHLFGAALLVNLRQHIGLIGRSGSGKSSGLWILIDRFNRCSNADWVGADLSNGPAIPAAARSAVAVAYEPEEVAALLDAQIELAQTRNAELRRRAESDDVMGDENWDPTPAAPARYVVIDEFHILADNKELLDRVKLLARIGRKACVFLVLATPGAGKEDMGSTIIRGMVGLKILFACMIGDITAFLGGRMAELGWRPDKLSPAAAGNPRDAGKAFIWDGDHPDPEVVRVSRLDVDAMRKRSREVARARISEAASGAVETDREPLPLDLLLAAFEHYELEKISVGWLRDFVTERHPKIDFPKVVAGIKAANVTSRSVNRGPWPESNPKGYHRSDLRE